MSLPPVSAPVYVYVRRTGVSKRYHQSVCANLSKEKMRQVVLADAIAKGQTACMKCRPDAKPVVDVKQAPKPMRLVPIGSPHSQSRPTTVTPDVKRADFKYAEITMNRAPIAYTQSKLAEIDQLVKERTPPPMIVIADTEGAEFISEISFQSLTDGVNVSQFVKTHPRWKLPQRTDAVTLREVFDQLDTETAEHKVVYVLFHNGAAHDVALLKRMSAEEKFDVPSRYLFGDTLPLLRRMFVTSSVPKGFGEKEFYLQLFGRLPAETTDAWTWHVAAFDTFHLRRILRFLAMYLIDTATSHIESAITAARDRLVPDLPLSNRHIYALTHWLDHESVAMHLVRTLKPSSAFKWVVMPDVKLKPARVFLPDVIDGLQPMYVSANGRRHYQSCPMTTKFQLKLATDLKELQTLAFCQKCATAPAPE